MKPNDAGHEGNPGKMELTLANKEDVEAGWTFDSKMLEQLQVECEKITGLPPELEDIEAVLIVLRQLGLLTEDARQSKYLGQMEALDAVFQMNGPSRAITKLKKQYTAEAVRL